MSKKKSSNSSFNEKFNPVIFLRAEMIAMIKLTRVDYRLIHGQVAMSWTHALDVDCILLASDAVAKDDMRKAALRLARPNGVKLVIKDVNAAIEALNSGVTDKYSLFIIVETIEDAYRLAKGCKGIKEINLGGTRKTPETTLHPTPAIFATETDAEHIQELVNDGVVIEIRQVPNDSKVFAKDVF